LSPEGTRESDIIMPMSSRELTLEAKAAGAHTRELVRRARRLPLLEKEWLVEAPRPGWALGMVSWMALDGEGARAHDGGGKPCRVVPDLAHSRCANLPSD
jgi:hypothetical protein